MRRITIIGAGLGGLSAGALLAKRGFKVSILEQHNIVGGCATTFKRKDITCEVGLHEMENVYEDSGKRALFEELDLYNHINFVRVPEFFRHLNEEFDFTIAEDIETFKSDLIGAFPKESKAIMNYFYNIEAIAKEYEKMANLKWYEYALLPIYIKTILRFKSTSLQEYLDQAFKNERLKMILNTSTGYYANNASELSFLLHGVAQYGYYKGGGYFIQGGSQKLSDYLASIITKHGGEVITKALVEKIEPQSVSYRRKKETHTLQSDIIISNMAPASTYAMANIAYNEPKEVSDSLISVYIGFKNSLYDIYGKKAYSTFFASDAKSIKEKEKGFIFVDYSQIDAKLTPEHKSFGAICTNEKLSNWENLTKEEYKAKKEAMGKEYLRILDKEYPNIEEHIEFMEFATPKTMQRYTKTPNGTAYGFKATKEQFFRIPKLRSNKMKNLYFVGAWVIGGGFTPALLSGKMCADLISKKLQP